MRLRVANKICKTVFDFHNDIRFLNRHLDVRYDEQSIQKAMQVCRRHSRHKRLRTRPPHIPSESEMLDVAEVRGCILFDLAEILGVPKDEIEKKKDEFLEEMDRCRNELG